MNPNRIARCVAALALVLAGPTTAHWSFREVRARPDALSHCPGQVTRWNIYDRALTSSGNTVYLYSPEELREDCSTFLSPGATHGEVALTWDSIQCCAPRAVCNRYPQNQNHDATGYSDGDKAYAWECVAPQYFAALPAPPPRALGPCRSCPQTTVGNPIDAATGNKVQEEVDYRGPGEFPLSFGRFYNSQDARVSRFGRGWRHLYGRGLRKDFGTPPFHSAGSPDNTSLFNSAQAACEQGWPQIRARAVGLANTTATFASNTCTLKEGATVRGTLPIHQSPHGAGTTTAAIFADRGDGESIRFAAAGSTFSADPDVTARLELVTGGYRYTDDDVVETYDDNGRLLSIRSRSGITQTLQYDTQGRLSSVTDSFGRSLLLTFDAADRFGTLTDPDGRQYAYAYNAGGDIESVTFPDGKVRRYHYEDAAFPRLLTGITDENGGRFASWTYDAMGRAKSSEHAGGAGRVDLGFNADGTSTVTDALGTGRTYAFEKINGVDRIGRITQPCPGCGGVASALVSYDAKGFVASRTDFNGNLTTYVHDSRGLETSRTEASGTALAGTITTQWHASYRLPTQIDEPGRHTVYTYDAGGNRLSATTLDTATGESRTTNWTYNTLGQVLTVDGPRADVADVTTHAYGAQGNLASITNALGQVTQITAYDAHGNPQSITDPNGVVATLGYDLRQRLKSRTVAGATTLFDYDGAGRLTRVTLPGGSFLDYGYDTAHRLTDIVDGAGNRIHYTLDALGNRTQEDVRDSSGALKRTSARVFDALGRLQQLRNAAAQVVSEFGYDAQGNRTRRTDAGDFITASEYDPLNRLRNVTDAAGGVTQYAHDALGQLVSVTDPGNLATQYTRNALGDLLTQASPDTGTTRYAYDAAGNRMSQTDARGVTTGYGYDALNRLVSIDYPGTAEDVSYAYDGANDADSAVNGTGRLTGIRDESGETTLIYDARGNVLEERRASGGATWVTRYGYDAADRIVSVAYPGGRQVSYERDSLGQVSRVTTTIAGVTSVVADNIQHQPFGGIGGYVLGNGVAVTRAHDQDGRVSELKDQGTGLIGHRNLYYDLRGNVDAILDNADAARSQAFDYDALSRLTGADGAYGLQTFAYDGVGNRLSETMTPRGGSSATDIYSYAQGSHRLASISGARSVSFAYDEAGNVVTKGDLAMNYNSANRAFSVVPAQAGTQFSNLYNAAGQRVQKTTPGGSTAFHYDRDGQLLEETDAAGKSVREYVWLGNILLAVSSAPAPDPAEQVVDNGQALVLGRWQTKARPAGYLGNNFLQNSKGKGLESVTWPFALTQRARYEVFARWVSANNRASNAPYTIQTVNGPVTVPVDQSAAGGEWVSLGQFELDQVNNRVSLTDTGDGSVAADAVRIVRLSDPPPVLSYAHIDHLGTPQRLTDPEQNVVWDASYEPFGEASLGVSAVENSLRFPGQYFDAETGMHQNWFRDYDANLGRYLQSDPIGLDGGVNMYAYAELNPIRYIDRMGLWVKRCARKLGDKDKPATNQNFYNLLRHDYLNVNGEILSFQAGSNMALSQGRIDNDEDQEKGCEMLCDDDKFDQYVLDAANEVGAPKYCIVAYPGTSPHMLGARNCQTWVDDVIKKAKKKYLEKESCPKCFR